MPALSIEREALWKRVGEAAFLTDDEKRAATGYEPLPPSSLTRLLAKYSPDQPRVPAGNSDGGQWTSGGGYGAESEETSDLEQPLILAPDQPGRDDLLGLQEIANHPVIRTQIDEAWMASKPESDLPQEQGFWIVRDNATGELSTRPFANIGSRASIMPGPKPEGAIAFFHTHPNLIGYRYGPSAADISFANHYGLPGLIRSHNGLYYFGPRLGR